jgi:hypothetical protein
MPQTALYRLLSVFYPRYWDHGPNETTMNVQKNDDKTSSSIPSNVIELRRRRSWDRGEKNVCAPPTSFCNKLQKTSICYGLLHTKGGITTSSSLYLSLLLGLRREERERDDKSKKATPHIWEELRRSARSRNLTPTHTHPSSRAEGISLFSSSSFLISGNVLHHPACSIDNLGGS